MGSSARKKHEKKKDFQKPKLKVGKARPKPTNFTDTSFKSKGIVLAQQSISTTAPSPSSQFSHHVSLLSSRQSSQRRDSLAHIATTITSRPVDTPLPQPVSILLPKLLPRILDESNGVRSELLRVFRTLPPHQLEPHVGQCLLYIRAGLTHLAADIRSSATDYLLWIIDVCPVEVVSCSGGWIKTLKCLMTVLHWDVSTKGESGGKWTSSRAVNLGSAGSDGKISVKSLNALAAFLHAGLAPPVEPVPFVSKWPFPYRNVECHMIPKRSNAFAYLNLFGSPRDEESEMYVEREERQSVFGRRFQSAVENGVDAARKEGGETGRAAAGVDKALTNGMAGFESER